METRKSLRSLVRDSRGNSSLQSVTILALALLILTGLKMIWAPGPGGTGGLMAQVENKFQTIFNGGNEDPGSQGPGGGGAGDDSGNDGSEDDPQDDDDSDGGGEGSGDDGDDSGKDDSGTGGEDPDDEEDGGDADAEDKPEEEPGEKDDDWDGYLDVAMAVALESSKAYGQKIIDDAKTAALRQVARNDPLLEAFGMSIGDFQIDSPAARSAVFQGAGVMVDAVVGADALIQGDRKVKELARAGDYRGAWRTTWSTPAKFIADTIFASKAVDLVLSRLPTSAQIAVKVGVPEAVEGATGAAADVLFDPVATRINAALWNLHDRGLVPEPRMPRP